MERRLRWKRRVDRRLKHYGEVDYEQKLIRVNPSKGDLINTIIHEELHRRYPSKSEAWVRKKTKEREKKISINEVIALLQKYRKRVMAGNRSLKRGVSAKG